jgi:hypothetical protein
MRSQFHLIGRDRRARRNTRPCVLVLLLLFVAVVSSLHAQVGNQNPGGASGIFNGQVHTGCSYDPYTSNATRSVTDISVAGAAGEYSLALVRTANSRASSTTEVFGWAGGWNHNYNWILEDSPTGNAQNFQPKRYTIDFPDGRVETFRAVTWNSLQTGRNVMTGPPLPRPTRSKISIVQAPTCKESRRRRTFILPREEQVSNKNGLTRILRLRQHPAPISDLKLPICFSPFLSAPAV